MAGIQDRHEGEGNGDIRIGARLLSGRLDLAAGGEPAARRGAQVYAPSLDGCGERKHQVRPGITTETHADEIAQLLFYEDLQRCRAGRHQLGRHGGVPGRRS